MACPSLPKHINVAMVYTDSYHKVLNIMRMTKEHLGELASACEFMDNVSTAQSPSGHRLFTNASVTFYVILSS